ncbi:hypothetical protein UFOVP623_31 [uncultured Caudovirales phage]|uniref:Uncharacterized protein n=1 Tax=uncultured Caudovirales phage TaxID=2100421 RepID=A0A6J5ND83_9CAUD|nr:hypothetical protein UFOVP623_31 [uncultured Caudovirales phage]
MAKFANDTLTQVAGFDGQILAQELVYNQKDFWNLTWKQTINNVVTPINLTGVTIDAKIIRRNIANLTDSRYGLQFDISDYTPTPTAISLSITNRNNTDGQFTMVIDDSAWSVMDTDPQLDINATDPVAFSGRIKLSFPAVGSTPAYDEQVFLLFLIRSDGVVN